MSVKSWELGQKLPIENKKKFDMILNITQLLEKYELEIQGIRFTADGEIVLTHDNIEIELGDGSNVAVQLMNLGSILEAEGLEGKINIKTFYCYLLKKLVKYKISVTRHKKKYKKY